jgi:hypothetical protein
VVIDEYITEFVIFVLDLNIMAKETILCPTLNILVEQELLSVEEHLR